MESISIKMKSVDTMEDKIFKKIREIGLVSTDISTVVEDCHALAIAICVGNTSLICGALAYLRSGVGFGKPEIEKGGRYYISEYMDVNPVT